MSTSTNKPLNLAALVQISKYEQLLYPEVVNFLDKFEEQTVWSEPIIVNKPGKSCIDITGRYLATDGTSTQVIHCVLKIIKSRDSHSFFLIVNEKRIPLSYDYSIEQIVYMITYAIPEQYRDPEVLKILYRSVSTDRYMFLANSIRYYENLKSTIEMLGLKDSKHVIDHLVSGNDTFQDMAMIRSYYSILADTKDYNRLLNNTKIFDSIKYAFKGMIEDAAKHNNHITEWIRCKWFINTNEPTSDIFTNRALLSIWSCCYRDPAVFNTVVHTLYNYFINVDNEEALKEKLYVKLPCAFYIDEYDKEDVYELIDWLNNHK